MPVKKEKDASCQRVTTAEAAKEIGCDVDYLRQMMKKKKWDLGEVIPPTQPRGIYRYLIFRPKLDKFLGKEAV